MKKNKPTKDDINFINSILTDRNLEANILLHSSLSSFGLNIIHDELFKLSLQIRDQRVHRNSQALSIDKTDNSNNCCIII